ncbi:MAG TPA: RsmE family RNA methyltransferase, partial [Acidimicrobiales bacterium]|nr:RsmE family RNA methyltransferase [Acidimicrobiales bacterium]
MRRAAAHVFVGDLTQPRLANGDFHHLSRVLRLRPGQTVTVGDGRGGWRLCEWAGRPELQPAGETVSERPPTPRLTVALASMATRDGRLDWAVQKLTETGVDRIVLMTSTRCVARWQESRVPLQLERLRAVARAAAMQSRRTWLPAVEGPLPFSRLASCHSGGEVALAELG